MKRTIQFVLVFLLGIIIGYSITYLSLKKILESKAVVMGAEGAEFLENKRYDSAIGLLNQAIALYPDNDLLHLTLAETYEATKKYDLAIKEYKEVLDLYAKEEYKKDYIKDIKNKIENLLQREKAKNKT